MSPQLLATKTRVPRQRTEGLPRPGLERLLDEGRDRRLTVVAAPAGFGKTTALVRWCSRPEARVAWFSLDGGDNDVGRFLAHLLAALRGVEPALGTLWSDTYDQGPALDWEPLLVSLVNEIAELEARVTLVLDDFHEVDDPSVHDAVGFLVDHAPPQLHVVLSSRVKPPLALGRLRVRDELQEIGATSLNFSREEADRLLRDRLGLELPARAIDLLHEKTEGWPAGVQLAGLALRGSEDPEAVVATFSGQHRFVLDFLTDEVLETQPQEVQRFLLETSILERLSASLCEAVTRNPRAGEHLERLEAESLFLLALDERREQFRYHQLFRELLERHLLRSSEDAAAEIRELHRRAWRWHVERGEASEGLEHGIGAEDWDGVTEALTPVARRLTQRGAYRDLDRLLDRLPDELRDEPRIQVWRATSFLAHGRLDEAEALLREVGGSGLESDPMFSSLLLGHRLVLARLRGRHGTARELATRALAEIPEERRTARARAETSLALVDLAEGDLKRATARLERVVERVDAARNFFAWSAAQTRLGAIERLRGDLDASEQRLLGVIEAGRALCRQVPVLTYVTLAETLHELDRLDEAEQVLRVAFETEDLQGRYFLPEANLVSARLHAARNRTEEALTQLRRALESENPSSRFVATKVLILTRVGRHDEARRAAEVLRSATPAEEVQDVELLALATLAIEDGDPADAVERLTEPLIAAEARGDRQAATLLLATQAAARAAQRDTRQAHAALGRALGVAQEHGFRRALLDVGERMARLLGGFLQEDPERSPLAVELLERLGGAGDGSDDPRPPAERLIEPLSDREREVLGLLVAGLSNDEIADRIFLSKNTVKTHLRNLYGKLGVHNRVQAIERGRSLGLLAGS